MFLLKAFRIRMLQHSESRPQEGVFQQDEPKSKGQSNVAVIAQQLSYYPSGNFSDTSS